VTLDQLRGHQLLPQDIRDQMPPLYSGEALGLEALAIVKLFTPRSNWTWYASEGSPVDVDGYYDTDKEKVEFLMFGLVSGFEVEMGYFALAELETVRDRSGLPAVERDLYFKPDTLGKFMKLHRES
jgi:Protein of unknown function (DUF2958)